MLSGYLILKHIISCYEIDSYHVSLFIEIKPHSYSPFWVEQQLTLMPQFKTRNREILIVDHENSVIDSSGSICESAEVKLVNLEDEDD